MAAHPDQHAMHMPYAKAVLLLGGLIAIAASNASSASASSNPKLRKKWVLYSGTVSQIHPGWPHGTPDVGPYFKHQNQHGQQLHWKPVAFEESVSFRRWNAPIHRLAQRLPNVLFPHLLVYPFKQQPVNTTHSTVHLQVIIRSGQHGAGTAVAMLGGKGDNIRVIASRKLLQSISSNDKKTAGSNIRFPRPKPQWRRIFQYMKDGIGRPGYVTVPGTKKP